MSTQRSTIGLVVTLSALLIVLAFITREVLDLGPHDEGIQSRITVSGMEETPGSNQ